MQITSQLVPSLVTGRQHVPIVIDDEVGISLAIEKHLICANRVICWNHIISSAEVWLKKHGAGPTEIPAYTSHIRELLDQSSDVCYENKLKELKEIWSQPFCRYYQESIHSKVPGEVIANRNSRLCCRAHTDFNVRQMDTREVQHL